MGPGSRLFTEVKMMGLPWFKVAADLADHPKIRRLDKTLPHEDPVGVVVRMWAWTARYAPSGECELADFIDASSGFVQGDYATQEVICHGLERAGWVTVDASSEPGTVTVHGWDEWQIAHVESDEAKRDSSRERVRRHRERKANQSCNADVTDPVTVTVTPCNALEEKRVEEKRQEEDAATSARADLVASLVGEFLRLRGDKYEFKKGRDGKAIKFLLGKDSEEVGRRWRKGLTNTGFPKISNIHQLETMWNDLGSSTVSPQATASMRPLGAPPESM